MSDLQLSRPRPPFSAGVLAVLLGLTLLAGCGAPGTHPALKAGRDVYADTCSVCHGPRGEGGIGPTLEAVAATWPSCTDHITWISLGSDNWITRFGATYGATEKLVEGGMPGQEANLKPEEIAAVAVYERVEYAGVDPDRALTDCGFEVETGG